MIFLTNHYPNVYVYIYEPVFNGKVDGTIYIYRTWIHLCIYIYIIYIYIYIYVCMKTQRNKYMGKYVPQIMKGLWIKLKNWHAQETCNSQAVFQQTCNRTHNWSTLYQGKLTSTPSTSHTCGSSTKRKAAAMDYIILVLGPTYGGYFHSYTH